MTDVTLDDLRKQLDFSASASIVREVLERECTQPQRLLRFIGRYTAWNGLFGSGVAGLASKIGRSRDLFVDSQSALSATADRSVFVASFFFDAARDEFDDSKTPHRDSHRCLAQATLLGVLGYLRENEQGENDGLASDAEVDALLRVPMWLKMLMHRVHQGYGGNSPDDLACIARGMGYHLGSEILADQEFSLIDSQWRKSYPSLVGYLEGKKIKIADQEHNAYAWLRIHSGYGDGAEADHFNWAVKGVRKAFEYTPKELHGDIKHQVLRGFRDFAADHAEFFAEVGE